MAKGVEADVFGRDTSGFTVGPQLVDDVLFGRHVREDRGVSGLPAGKPLYGVDQSGMKRDGLIPLRLRDVRRDGQLSVAEIEVRWRNLSGFVHPKPRLQCERVQGAAGFWRRVAEQLGDFFGQQRAAVALAV